MANFLLVHGAFHGGWCWERLAPLLIAKGHHVLAPDLPGMGADPTPLADVNLPLWSRHIVGLLEELSGPAILVGHSRGGIVISQAANDAPDRVAALVYVTALMMPDGCTMASLICQLEAIAPGGLDAVPTEDGAGLSVTAAALAEKVYTATDAKGLSRAIALVTPEPVTSLAAAPCFSNAAHLPRAYIECLRDRTLPIAYQRFMQQAWPCDPVLAIDTDHCPQFSAPRMLADALDGLAERWSSSQSAGVSG